MFETSFILFIQSLLVNILLPLLPWLCVMRLLLGNKFQWIKLYILARFLWVWVVSNWMFDIQFIHFGVWIWEYMLLLILLIWLLILKIWKFWFSVKELIHSLSLRWSCNWLFSLLWLSSIEKVLSIAGLLFVTWFLVNSFVHTISFPSYADDTFGNWHKPAVNIYYDGWFDMFGEESQILGRARLWYPIQLSIYKATVSQFMWAWYEMYANLFQWIGFLLILLLSYVLSFEKTKNVFYGILPSILMCWLPLVFWHVIDGYHELPSVYYSIISLYLLYEYLKDKDTKVLVLASLFLWILSYVKNDGFVIYMPAIILSFVLFLVQSSQLKIFFRWLLQSKQDIGLLIWGVVLFLLPFLGIKQYYNLWFNQAQWASSGIGLSGDIHWEIFSQFKILFFTENNYNLIILIFLLIGCALWWVKRSHTKWLLLYWPLCMFILFTLVFLVTDNYVFVMNQTTVNRTYMACFMIISFYCSLLLCDDHSPSSKA